MNTKKLTNLQKRKRLERSRHDERTKKLKRYNPLCVNRGFFEYALNKGWDDETVDAAALFMHRCFIRQRDSDNAGWIPMPYQVFENMFGKKYKDIRDRLIESGFLERDEERGHKIGGHCAFYRLCDELRNNWVSTSYYLKSEGMQERYIENKKRWTQMSAAKRQAHIAGMVEHAFSTEHVLSTSRLNRRNCSSYYYLVQKGDLSKEQFETIKRLAANSHLLQLKINAHDVTDIANNRYQKKAKTLSCDFEAYEQIFQEMVDRTFEPRISVKANGRFYSPYTGIPREMWEHVRYKGNTLASIDVKSSHVICLLAFIKDIDLYYFGSEGTHDERLAGCRFGKQITIVKGLTEHLRRSCLLFQAQHHFKFNPFKSFDATQLRNTAFFLFRKFTKSYIRFIQAENGRNTGSITNEPINRREFLRYIQELPDMQLLTSSIANNSNTQQLIFTNLQKPLPYSPISTDDSVGVSLQPMFYHGLIEKIRACRFSLKTLPEFEGDDPSISNAFPFRNLYFPSTEEIAEFEKLLDGDFYSCLMNTIGVSETMSRDEFKKCFFHFLYRRACCRFEKRRHWEYGMELHVEKREEPVRKAFETLLPSITFFLDLCKCRPGTLDRKGSYYKGISRAMLSVESQIMLECCANIWKKYPKMFLVTVHDCIKCLRKDVKKVRTELIRTWEKYHVSPKFDVKIHAGKGNLDGQDCNHSKLLS